MISFSEMKWMLRGYCSTTQANPEVFQEPGNEETAKAFCSQCPVIATCREWALRNEEVGVWGGTSEADRRAIRRGGKRLSCPACNTYHLHQDDNMQICLSCGMSWC